MVLLERDPDTSQDSEPSIDEKLTEEMRLDATSKGMEQSEFIAGDEDDSLVGSVPDDKKTEVNESKDEIGRQILTPLSQPDKR